VTPPDFERPRGLFEYGLPRVMRRLLADRSPEAFLDAGVTYNQFVEGCLAIAGYRMWNEMFHDLGVFPGLQEGLTLTQRDERRHIAYGTYLCRRLIARDPDLFEFAQRRMLELQDNYLRALPRADGNGSKGDGGGYGDGGFQAFVDNVVKQVPRRIAILERARSLTPDEAEFGTGAEEAEAELETVAR
jgi:hypothetical protein